MRIHDPLKQWKLSPMDVESRRLWEAYTKAKEAMLERTNNTSSSPSETLATCVAFEAK